jgi:molybdopterin converting factor subunit 1
MTVEGIEVKVTFFAGPRETLGTNQVLLEIPAGSTVRDLITLLVEEYPALQPYARFVSIAVNRAYVGMQTTLHDGDEAAFLPPVGGG